MGGCRQVVLALGTVLGGALFLGAPEARAGAWPRAEGELFLSFGAGIGPLDDAGRPPGLEPTLYLEYGLRARLTLGLDAYATTDGGGALFGWLRLPWRPEREGADRWAVSAGLGAMRSGFGAAEPAMRLGLHWGRGLDDGWLAVDARGEFGLDRPARHAKIEATLGRRLSPGWDAIAQGQLGQASTGDPYAGLGGAVVWHLREGLDLRIGLTRALTGEPETALAIEGWLRF